MNTEKTLDMSQKQFCMSDAKNIRLLAPAGCGKTSSLLHRCKELTDKGHKPRILIFTFTKSAAAELKERVENEKYFEPIRGQVNISTINSWGWKRIRSNSSGLSNPTLLTNPKDIFFAMKNQLRPIWMDFEHIGTQIKKPGNAGRTLMTVMDNLKSLGFVHTHHFTREIFDKHLDELVDQGHIWRIEEQYEILAKLGLFSDTRSGEVKDIPKIRNEFYTRFFRFWKKAVEYLHEQATFTFEDQKYWNYLDLNKKNISRNPAPKGVTQYDHIMVDEFQDVNPLDLALIKELTIWHNANLTLVGDDDQAIFEWRGASPEYILKPNIYFDRTFENFNLAVNYRSPENIVEHSQSLIRFNHNRVEKEVKSAGIIALAQIDVIEKKNINEQLSLVSEIASSIDAPGRVAVISRLRRQLIPYQVYFASKGAPFKTAIDLDVFSSDAFDNLIKLLEIKERSRKRQRSAEITKDVIEIFCVIRRRPLGKKDRNNLTSFLRSNPSNTVLEALEKFSQYNGPKFSGKTHNQLYKIAMEYLSANGVPDTLRKIGKKFDGLQFDREKAEKDVFYTAPPLVQLAEICESECYDSYDLIERIEDLKEQVDDYKEFEENMENDQGSEVLKRPLHLMTATRAKGKEFDTVILLDAVQGIWPYKKTVSQRELEAERRLFYVAFTRARKRVVILLSSDEGESISQFVDELGII